MSLVDASVAGFYFQIVAGGGGGGGGGGACSCSPGGAGGDADSDGSNAPQYLSNPIAQGGTAGGNSFGTDGQSVPSGSTYTGGGGGGGGGVLGGTGGEAGTLDGGGGGGGGTSVFPCDPNSCYGHQYGDPYVRSGTASLNPTTHINLSPGSPDGGTSPDQTAWYKSPAGVSISTTDTGGPGVKEMRCVLDPASVPTGWNDFPSGCAVDGTSVSASGHHTIYAISRDWDGRASAVAHSSFSVDATAPTVTPLFNGSSTLARSYSSDVTVTYSCQDEANGSGVDPATCPQGQTFTYEDDTSATVPAQSAQDYAGNSGSSNSVKITFEKGQPDDVVLAGDCGAAVFCPHYLTTTEADGTVSLRGYIEAPQNDDGFLRINWGDGSPIALYFYPCDPSATSCPFSNGPTFDTGVFIPPPGQDIFFRFDHTYANNPIGGSTYTITVNSVESDGGASTPQTTTATVTDVAPSLTLEPDCRDVFCVYPPSSTLTATTSTPVSLSGQVTDPGLDTGTVTIDWGDGSADTTVPFDCQTAGELCPTPSQQNAFVCGLTQTAGPGCGFFLQSHTYAHTGTYTISATATDQDGESSSVQTTSATVASLPLVATQPQNQNVVDSTTVSFSSTATAIPSPTVQWQVSTDGGKTFSDISGATSTTLSFTAVVSMSGNEYRAVFTTAAGSVDSDAATLTVGIPPSITTQPIDTTVGVGQTATFTAGAFGNTDTDSAVVGFHERWVLVRANPGCDLDHAVVHGVAVPIRQRVRGDLPQLRSGRQRDDKHGNAHRCSRPRGHDPADRPDRECGSDGHLHGWRIGDTDTNRAVAGVGQRRPVHERLGGNLDDALNHGCPVAVGQPVPGRLHQHQRIGEHQCGDTHRPHTTLNQHTADRPERDRRTDCELHRWRVGDTDTNRAVAARAERELDVHQHFWCDVDHVLVHGCVKSER